MKDPVWILPEVVIAVHQMLLAEHGGRMGVRDEALLDSALSRPRHRYAYQENSTLFDLAASYSYGMAKNHPFVDGNKRVALSLAAIFLDLNGYRLDASEPEAVLVFEQLAAGELPEELLSDWLKESSIAL